MTLTDDDEYGDWRPPGGIFVLAPISGAAADAVRQLQHHFDAKLATAYPPHVTVAGSSGVGPIRPGTSIDEIRRCLTPVADATPALSLSFGRPQRFMQTNVVSLPLSPHGPLRVVHDLIARSGLAFGSVRFTFTPHVTLNLYRSLTPEAARALLAVRIPEPAILDRLLVSATDEAGPPRTLLELPFAATAPARWQP